MVSKHSKTLHILVVKDVEESDIVYSKEPIVLVLQRFKT